jgi:hypothetical protein
MGLGSRIRKKPIPDPGSGSATLLPTLHTVHTLILTMYSNIHMDNGAKDIFSVPSPPLSPPTLIAHNPYQHQLALSRPYLLELIPRNQFRQPM